MQNTEPELKRKPGRPRKDGGSGPTTPTMSRKGIPLAEEVEAKQTVKPVAPSLPSFNLFNAKQSQRPASTQQRASDFVEGLNAAQRASTLSEDQIRKNQARFQKEAEQSENLFNEAVMKANMMNEYKDKYKTKIIFKWKNGDYVAEDGLNFLDAQIQLVQLELNTSFVPSMMKGLIISVTKFCEDMASVAQLPYLRGVTDEVKKASEKGLWNDEIEQLAIIYKSWFAQSPERRLAFKYGGTVANQIGENIKQKRVMEVANRSGARPKTAQGFQDL